MNIEKKDLQSAVSEQLISTEQAEALWKSLEKRNTEQAVNLPNVAYYLGAMIVIAAMGWLMVRAWDDFNGGAIFMLSALYALLFAITGSNLWFRQKLSVPGGLFFTMAVCMTPLAVYGLEKLFGVWPEGNPGSYQGFHFWVKGSWFFMEVATILAGLAALKYVRFPFLAAPIAFTLWYMSMDLTPLLFGKQEFTYEESLNVSLLFGLVMLVVSYEMDGRTTEDFAYWGYLFGMLAFWGGLSLMESSSEFNKFLYCMLNVGLIFLSVFLERRVFIVFGALGVNGYLGYLAYRVFKDSALFPFVLVFLGIFIIFLGLQYQRHRERIENLFIEIIPEEIRQLRPANRSAR